PLVEHHQLFALFEAPERRRQRADVHRLGGYVEKVGQQPTDLGIDHADELRAPRHLDSRQSLDSETVRVLLIHRRDIVEPVKVRQRLQERLVLNQLLGTAMQQPDVRIDTLDHLAIQIEHQAKDAVRSRMLRTEVDRELAILDFGACERIISHGYFLASLTFSSPGITACIPSHGERKSKLRNSCISLTGSYTTRFWDSS